MDTSSKEDMADLIDWFYSMANTSLEKENIPLRIKKTQEVRILNFAAFILTFWTSDEILLKS